MSVFACAGVLVFMCMCVHTSQVHPAEHTASRAVRAWASAAGHTAGGVGGGAAFTQFQRRAKNLGKCRNVFYQVGGWGEGLEKRASCVSQILGSMH